MDITKAVLWGLRGIKLRLRCKLWYMIYEVTTTAQADADLRCIYEHIAFELLSPDNAAWQRLKGNAC